MFDVGLGVRLIVAATPAPPVPAPPGRSPFPLSSSLCRPCYNWWFSNGNAHGRDTTTTTSSRATTRRWWSDPDGSQDDYGSSSLEEEDDHDYDYEDETVLSGFGWAKELFDESWFSKVSKTYGVILPVMLTSMFAATGLKTFLMAMAIPLSQSAISFLLKRKRNRDYRWPWMIFFKKKVRSRRPLFQEEEYPEDATDFATGGQDNGYSSSSSSSNYYEGRRRRHNYESWVSKDFAAAATASTAVGADDDTKSSSSSGDGRGNKSSGAYGGWDELLDNNTAAAQKAKRSSNRSQLATLMTARNRSLQRLGTKIRIIPPRGARVEQGVRARPERMRMRRRRWLPRTMGLGSTRYKPAPLLMRLFVAVFPFLGSWFRLL